MSADRKVPEIRFKGFSGEWLDVTLSNIVDVRSGKDYKHLGNGNVPVYGTGGYMLSVDSALSNNEDAIGIGRKGTIDKPYILRAPFWTVDTLFYAVPFSNFNIDFLFCFFQKIDWKKYDESTGVPSLSKVAINSVLIYTTNKLEQIQIGNYFQKLDTLIDQHQNKHDKLCNIKKAMLEKMFPKQGETIPEIRFRGFSGEWMKNKLGQIYNFQYGEFNINPSNGGQYPVYGANGVIGGYTDFNAENSAVIGHMGEYAGSVLWVKGKHFVTYNGTIAKPKNSNFNPLFGFFLLVKMNLKKVCGGSGQPFLSYDVLEGLDVNFPAEKEQALIGNYFQKLDNLIDQHQQQITKLNNIKQACLSKMFV